MRCSGGIEHRVTQAVIPPLSVSRQTEAPASRNAFRFTAIPISHADKVDTHAIIAKHRHVLLQQAGSDLASVGISAELALSLRTERLLVYYVMKSI